MTSQDKELPMSREWLLRMAELEDVCGVVSVGGLAQELGMLEAPRDIEVIRWTAFGKLVELARRRVGLGIEALARQANLVVEDLIQLERGDATGLVPRVVFQLCAALDLPQAGVMELVGLTHRAGKSVAEAAARFAAWPQGVDQLTVEERNALQEFERVLAAADAQG